MEGLGTPKAIDTLRYSRGEDQRKIIVIKFGILAGQDLDHFVIDQLVRTVSPAHTLTGNQKYTVHTS